MQHMPLRDSGASPLASLAQAPDKLCHKCEIIKPLSEFAFKDARKLKRQSCCRHCQRITARNHYLRRKESYYARRLRNRRRYVTENKKRIADILSSSGCVDCGVTDTVVLDFDHVRGRKSANVAALVGTGICWKRIAEEIAKCEIRCANCHRRRTAERSSRVQQSRAVAQPGRASRLGRESRRFKSCPPEVFLNLPFLAASKRCPYCDTEKPVTEFRSRSSGSASKASYCGPCERIYNRNYYRLVDAPKQRLRVAKNDVLYRHRNRTRVLKYLSTQPCGDCGESDPTILEFDHITPDKIASVSRLKHRNTRWTQIAKEIAKCEVRCVNCHRRRTFKQFNYSR
jgi:hypothetical protein